MKSSQNRAGLTKDMLARIEQDLQDTAQILAEGASSEIYEMISHHFGWRGVNKTEGGKRLRPLLVLLSAMAAGGDWETAIPVATAVEFIHNFSLIHDDIQDGSFTRRGRPTVWSLWGEAQAINTGDAIFALSRLTTSRLIESAVASEVILRTQALLDQTCIELTRGQYLDLHFEARDDIREDQYFTMIQGKTAALISASTACGAYIADPRDQKVGHYKNFGQSLGVAFQIVDDLLGIWGSSDETGKSTFDDLSSHKKTLPVIYGLENSDPFRQLWKKEHPDRENLNAMRVELERAGALEHTRQEAKRHSLAAEASLLEAQPVTAAADILREIPTGLLERTK